MRLLTLCLFFIVTQLAQAANFSVTNSLDFGAGSLRQAILDANASGAVPHTITFTAAYPQSGIINLTSDLPPISAADVRIKGNSRGPTISGGTLYSIFQAELNVSILLEDLNMRSGLNESGGCVATTTNGGAGSLTVTGSYFYQCKAVESDSPGGGAISWTAASPATVSISDSIFLANQANSSNVGTEQPRGGAIRSSATSIITGNTFVANSTNSAGNHGGYGGAIALFLQDPNGISSITENRFESNSTGPASTSLGWGGAVRAYLVPGGLLLVERNFFFKNQAREGGALFLDTQMLSATTQVSMFHNTFVENSAALDGGGIHLYYMQLFAFHNTFYNNSGASGSHLSFDHVKLSNLVHNVLSGNAGASSACEEINTNLDSAYFAGNLFEESCGTLSLTGGSISANLAVKDVDESEVVGVVVFMEGADPIDGGTANPSDCKSPDARGNARPQDGDNDGSATCDVGAFESPSDIFFADGFES